MVARESRFYVTNIAIPTAVFSGLAFTLFAAPPSKRMERLTVALTLLLTMAAYKITVTGMIPQVSYETLLDKFLLCNFFLLVFLVIASALLPQAEREAEDLALLANASALLPQAEREAEDLAHPACFALLGAFWFLIQAWFVAKAVARRRRTEDGNFAAGSGYERAADAPVQQPGGRA